MFYSKLAAVFYVIIFSLLTEGILCDIFVYNIETHAFKTVFKDVPSTFGDGLPAVGLRGVIVVAKPENGCTEMVEPPVIRNFTGKWIALIKRYGCLFEDKVRNAQKAGFDVAIVHNVNSNDLEPMAANDSTGIYIPSVFISAEAGFLIKEHYLYKYGYYVSIDVNLPFSITPRLLLIFSILVGLSFFVAVIFTVVKYFKDRRQQRRQRLPKSLLKKLGIHKFAKNDPYEMCAICLEEYVENDKLRVLPCSHAYHAKCVDPWLTKNRRVCPVCKRKIFPTREVVTDPDSDDETAPLVRNSSTASNAGTFVRQIENPFRSAMARTERHQSESSEVTSSETTSTTGSVTHSIQSMPEMPRPTGEGEEVRNLIQEPSINSAEVGEVPAVRTTWHNFFRTI